MTPSIIAQMEEWARDPQWRPADDDVVGWCCFYAHDGERYGGGCVSQHLLAAATEILRLERLVDHRKDAARGSKPVRVETGTGSIEDESRAEGLAQNTPES